MMSRSRTPVKAFGLHVAHVGINAASPEEAQQVADLFQALMGLEPNVTPVSVFAGTLVEVMSGCDRGEKGHIGFGVNDIATAEKWFRRPWLRDQRGLSRPQPRWLHKARLLQEPDCGLRHPPLPGLGHKQGHKL